MFKAIIKHIKTFLLHIEECDRKAKLMRSEDRHSSST